MGLLDDLKEKQRLGLPLLGPLVRAAQWWQKPVEPTVGRPGYDATTAPADIAPAYSALAPDPGATYGEVLPYAHGGAGGGLRWAMPSKLREGLLGGLDLLAGTRTGEVTPRGLDTLLTGSALAGGALGAEGSLAAGGAPRRAPFRVPATAKADLEVPPAGIGHNMPPSYLDPEGGAIRGAAYSKASNDALAQVKAMEPGAGPLDLSGNQRIPGIQQEPIPRYDPNAPRRRGVPQRTQDALSNVGVQDAVLAAIDKGIGMGAHKWYHNRALYDAFVNELGPEEGHAQYQKYMDFQSAASPRSDVPTNIRNASYYFVNPQGLDQFEGSKNPYPYGHLGQVLHRKNADIVAADQGDWGGYDVMKNPKPPSYGTNLGGNLMPVAADTHAYRLIAMNTKDPRMLAQQIQEMSPRNPFADTTDTSKMSAEELAKFNELKGKAKRWGELATNDDGTPQTKDGKFIIRFRPQQLYKEGKLTMEDALKQPTLWGNPEPNEYKAVEDFYAEMGKRRGLSPAEAQSAAWAGGGEQTGLGTPSNRTFGQMHNERVMYTALMRGEDPKETLRALIRKERPLLSSGAPGAGGLLQQQQMSEEELRRGRGLLDDQRVY